MRIQLFLAVCFAANVIHAQVGIGTATPNASAIVDLASSNKGFLPPRMSTGSRLAITVVDGLVVYDTNEDALFVVSNGQWTKLMNYNLLPYELPYNFFGASSAPGDLVGSAVSLGSSGLDALVGAPGNTNGQGRVLRLHKSANNTWYMQAVVSPSELLDGDNFGYAVAMDRINESSEFVIGAPFDDSSTVTNMGCVFFYAPSALGATLRNKGYAPPADRVANARFGRSVDIAANTTNAGTAKGFAIVGAPGANSGKGAAYIFAYNPNTSSWDYEATLTDNLGANADSFGVAVSLYYNVNADTAWAFVGAPYDDEAQADAGSVTVFRKAAGSALWSRVAKISGTLNDNFGYSLANAMRCGWVAIGAAEVSTGNGGDVFVARLTSFSGGVASFTVTNPNSASGAQLGYSVSMMPNGNNCSDIMLLLGTRNGVTGPSSSVNLGLAKLFRYNGTTWNVVINEITDPTVDVENQGFGEAVSIHTDNRMMLISAPRQFVNGGANQGKVEFRKY